MAKEVVFKSYVADIKNAEEKAVEKALTMIGIEVEGRAADNCVVDTGLLRNSITYAVGGGSTEKKTYKANKPKKGSDKVESGSYSGTIGTKDEKAVYIGSNVEYAAAIEYGHSKKKPNGYLRPAVNQSQGNIKKIIEQEFGK